MYMICSFRINYMKTKYVLPWYNHIGWLDAKHEFTYLLILYYASGSAIHKHTCILKLSEESKPMGLKVDIAITTNTIGDYILRNNDRAYIIPCCRRPTAKLIFCQDRDWLESWS